MSYPVATSEMLEAACDAKIAMMIIDAAPLQVCLQQPDICSSLKENGTPFFGSSKLPGRCDHAVYLQSCDVANNDYVIWTWGTRVTVTKEILVGVPVTRPGSPVRDEANTFNTGMVCGFTTADSVTIA